MVQRCRLLSICVAIALISGYAEFGGVLSDSSSMILRLIFMFFAAASALILVGIFATFAKRALIRFTESEEQSRLQHQEQHIQKDQRCSNAEDESSKRRSS